MSLQRKYVTLAGLVVFVMLIVISSDKWLQAPKTFAAYPLSTPLSGFRQGKAVISENLNATTQHHMGTSHPPDPLYPRDTDVTNMEVEKDRTVADQLQKKVRVLIWVMTAPSKLTRALAVKNTWGRRCDMLLFFSSRENEQLQAIKQNVSEGREHLTAKTMQAFDYIYKHHYHEADWFMKADDDTYVVVENLHYFLADKDASKPWLTGRLLHERKQNFESGGAGYVLSKEALRRLANRRRKPPQCFEDGGKEDVHLAQCLQGLGVQILSSSDKQGRTTFHAFTPEQYALNLLPKYYFYYDAYVKVGAQHISEFPITFHYVYPGQMYMLDFYIYQIQAVGISQRFRKSTKQISDSAKKTDLKKVEAWNFSMNFTQTLRNSSKVVG